MLPDGSIQICCLCVPCPGDTNGDGIINVTDLGMNFGGLVEDAPFHLPGNWLLRALGVPAFGDADGDGDIDLIDYQAYSGCITGLVIQNLIFHPMPFQVACIHTKQHFRPILALCSTCAWMNGDNGVTYVILIAEQTLQFIILQGTPEFPEGLSQICGHSLISLFRGQLQKDLDIFFPGLNEGPVIDLVLEDLGLFQYLLGNCRIVPEIIFQGFFPSAFNLPFQILQVKDAPSASQDAP